MKKLELFDGLVEMGVSDIRDGNMRFFGEGNEAEVIKRQERLGEVIGLNGDKVARLRTIYDGRDEYTFYDEISENISEFAIRNYEKDIPVTDGLVTRKKDVGLLLPLADCVGVVVFDEKKRILGLLHAGRHNVEQYGPEKFVKFLRDDFGCEPIDLKVYFSPCAQNYQIYALNNQKMSDAVFEQLTGAGVLPENIENSGIDTVTDDDYPSCSNGDLKTRFAIVVRQTDRL